VPVVVRGLRLALPVGQVAELLVPPRLFDRGLVSGPAAATTVAAAITLLAVHAVG